MNLKDDLGRFVFCSQTSSLNLKEVEVVDRLFSSSSRASYYLPAICSRTRPIKFYYEPTLFPRHYAPRPFCPYSSLCVKLIPTHSIIITFCRFPSLLCSRHTLNRYHDISLSFQTFLSQPSSCLSDQEGDDIYDFAGKYRSSLRHHQAKILMTPQG